MADTLLKRRLSAGVELHDGGCHARVWAPTSRFVDFVLDRGGGITQSPASRDIHPLQPEADGFFSGDVSARPGDRYWFRLDGERLRPDPRSRYQPDGPHGPSQIVDPTSFGWSDAGWKGVTRHGQVVYELHVGTFTREGTWTSAARELPALRDLGVTVIEMMPIADFAGRFGWGYDGVNLYAPTRLYGTPDDLRRFVDAAHALGLGVILDVVYNHLGPDGNYLGDYSPDYFTDKYRNDWGTALNFEGPRPAREFFVENAGYWIDEYHFDGLRLDATPEIHDASPEHVIASISTRVRDAASGRSVFIVAENETQDVRLLRPREAGGYEVDAMWNDDFHHTAMVALFGRREAYYTDYLGSPQELVSASKYGFLYQGQWYCWQKQRRGTPSLDQTGERFVVFLQNHDQVANSASGRRIHQLTSPGRHRAVTALLLLGRATPMLFQGQEFNASAPFLYFADLPENLRQPVADGRREFLSQFPSITDAGAVAALAPPGDESTFEKSRLDLSERQTHAAAYALHRDLLALRRNDPVLAHADTRLDGAVLGPHAFVLRYFGSAGDRLLVINLSRDLDLSPAPEPLLAPPQDRGWRLLWSSEAATYGGDGTPPMHPDEEWRLPAESAVLFEDVEDARSTERA